MFGFFSFIFSNLQANNEFWCPAVFRLDGYWLRQARNATHTQRNFSLEGHSVINPLVYALYDNKSLNI